MTSANPFTAWNDPGGEDDGCAYLTENEHAKPCGKPHRARSNYCQIHHALTHIERGSEAEALRLREFNLVAKVAVLAIGGGGVVGPLPGEIEEIERRQLFIALRSRGLGCAGPPRRRT